MMEPIQLVGDKELSALLARIPAQKIAEAKAEVGAVALKIQARAKAYLRTAPAMDTGNCANSLIVEFAQGQPAVIDCEIGPTATYGFYIEFGAGPAVGHRQFFPPPDALEAWARHHGFDSAWPICKAIYRRGLRPRPYLGPAYDDFSGELEIGLERIMGKEWK